mmetsp:Transcript_24624/g.62557  ORF Transcript_24624/g.62557 Transcript_24624/m.62557 type:complete len:217 (-) Transcript_24624:68-718(-)
MVNVGPCPAWFSEQYGGTLVASTQRVDCTGVGVRSGPVTTSHAPLRQWLWCARQRGRSQAQSGDSGCSYGWDGQHGHSTRGSHEPGWPRVQRTWLARQPPSTRQWRFAREQHVGTCQRRQRAWGSRCICQADMHRLDAGARAGTTPVPTEVLVLTAAAAVAMCSEASAAGVANLNSLKRESAQTLQLPSAGWCRQHRARARLQPCTRCQSCSRYQR